MIDETRLNLKDHYKGVYTCTFCKKRYGSDEKVEKHKVCPVCLNTVLKGKDAEEKRLLILRSKTGGWEA